MHVRFRKTSALPCSNIETASQAGLPQGLRNWNWHDYDPRVSMAYRPFNDNKTVIRAGFGIYTMTTLRPHVFQQQVSSPSRICSPTTIPSPTVHGGVPVSANVPSGRGQR
jgi:hypothetical protein